MTESLQFRIDYKVDIIATLLCVHFGILITFFCRFILLEQSFFFFRKTYLPITKFKTFKILLQLLPYQKATAPYPVHQFEYLPLRIPSTCSANTFFKKYLSKMSAWVCCQCSDRNDSGTYCVSCGHFVCMKCYTVYGNKRSKPSATFVKCAQEYGYQQSREELEHELQKPNGLSTASTSEQISPKYEQLMELRQSNGPDFFDETSIGGMDMFQ